MKPTTSQMQIRDHEPLGLIITAPAGCGKTEALALRIRGMIDRRVVKPPRKILLVTFTNRAKENIGERLRTYLTPQEINRYITLHNLHGLSARIISAHGQVLGLDSSWKLPDSDWIASKFRERGLSYRQKFLINSHLQQAKLETRTDDEVLEYLSHAQDQDALEIERERQDSKQLTYDDLPRLADLILRNEKVTALYREHFPCIIIDEFQDLTLQQLSILQRIGRGRITYAGDLAQGIYGFTGAKPEQVLASARSEGIDEITFTESHRSSPAVLELVNSLRPRTGGVELECSSPQSWPGGGFAAHQVFESEKDEADGIVRFASGILSRAKGQRIGVLTRAKKRRENLDELLIKEAPFPWHRWDDPIFDSHIAPLLRSALRKTNPAQLGDADAQQHLLGFIDPLELQDPSTYEGLVQGCAWIHDLASEGISKSEINQRIKSGENETLLSAPGLHLVTGHAGKGQQFDWVIVMGLEQDSIPSFQAKTGPAIVEESRVLSVMISRARHGVLTTFSKFGVKPWGEKSKNNPSVFMNLLRDAGSYTDWEAGRDWLNGADWDAIAIR